MVNLLLQIKNSFTDRHDDVILHAFVKYDSNEACAEGLAQLIIARRVCSLLSMPIHTHMTAGLSGQMQLAAHTSLVLVGLSPSHHISSLSMLLSTGTIAGVGTCTL
jgi:hypothetical protein